MGKLVRGSAPLRKDFEYTERIKANQQQDEEIKKLLKSKPKIAMHCESGLFCCVFITFWK